MKNALNYLVIFWTLSVLFILSFIATAIAVFLLPSHDDDIKLMQECILCIIITFAGIIFLRNWIKAYKKNEEISSKKDYGLVWLAAAMLCWSFFISLDLLLVNNVKYLGPIFSSLNSLCFLFAIEYFDCVKEGSGVPKVFASLGINSGSYKRNVSFYVLGVLAVIVAIILAGNPSVSIGDGSISFLWSGIVDAVFLGLPTLFILLITLIETWSSPVRKDRWMVALTIIVLSFTFVMQFVNAWDKGDAYPLAFAISAVLYRVLLIMLFYGIAFSWTYSMLVKQNEEVNKAQKELEKRGMEVEFAHKNMRHGILNNVLILKMDLDNALIALKDVRDVPEQEKTLGVVTEIFNRYDFLLQISGLLYNPAEDYEDDVFFMKLMELIKKVLHLKDEAFIYKIDFETSLTKGVNQQRDFGIIAYELITNAKKYSSENAKIEVEIIGKKPAITLTVRDCGPNYFDVETARQQGKLRGLKSVLGRIEYYGGNYYTSDNSPGTNFVVVLPA